MQARADYVDKIDKLGDNKGDPTGKINFSAVNAYRNEGNKQLNKAENFIHAEFKDLGKFYQKSPELKKCLNVDYINAKKSFNEQDGYLKKTISEILNGQRPR